jgi:ABC-type uncharacterized transport system substrate-binding protein
MNTKAVTNLVGYTLIVHIKQFRTIMKIMLKWICYFFNHDCNSTKRIRGKWQISVFYYVYVIDFERDRFVSRDATRAECQCQVNLIEFRKDMSYVQSTNSLSINQELKNWNIGFIYVFTVQTSIAKWFTSTSS